MKGKSSHFAVVPSAEIQRSRFDRSHGLKTTFNSGYLVPVFCDEVLPGDTFNLSMSCFARLATPIKPIMDNLYLDSFFFFVPNRLVWDNWQRFNGEQDAPQSSTDYLVPNLATFNPAINSLFDFFGIPTGIQNLSGVNSLPFRAYNLIYNEWFRDQNLIDPANVQKDDGPDPVNQYILRLRGKRHDYFTSCLPWPQKGPAVMMPISGSAPITRTANAPAWRVFQAGTNNVFAAGTMEIGDSDSYLHGVQTGGGFDADASLDPRGGLVADLSEATAATINSLRQAFQLQKLFERDARGGTRYTEIIRSHFGVTSPDARLQRPEYLGGGSQMISINPVAQTSANENQVTPQGNLAAMGTVNVRGHGFSKSFVEHGFIIGLVSVRADLTYQQGLNRMWSRRTRFDYYWPALAHLGEQAVLNKEIYCQGGGAPADDEVFGYQERYAEYRYKPSQITSKFRSTSETPLDFWHLAQKFTTAPKLNNFFIQEYPPVERVLAVPEEPHFLADFWFRLNCVRPMPLYSVPGLIDHF